MEPARRARVIAYAIGAISAAALLGGLYLWGMGNFADTAPDRLPAIGLWTAAVGLLGTVVAVLVLERNRRKLAEAG